MQYITFNRVFSVDFNVLFTQFWTSEQIFQNKDQFIDFLKRFY